MEMPPLIYLGEELEASLAKHIEDQLVTHYAERASYVEELKNLLKDYFAKPTGKVTFPFEDASNIVVPLVAISVETTFANEMQQLFSLDQFITVKLPDQFSPLDHEIEKYLDWEFVKGIRMREALAAPLLEKVKYGTGIARMDYASTTKRIMVNGVAKEIVTSQGNELKFISLSRFLMPFNSQDPQTAQWCGEEHSSNVNEFKMLIKSGLFYDDIEKKMDTKLTNPTQNDSASLSSATYTQVVEEKTVTQPTWPNQIGWVQLWMSFDVNDDKKDEEIVVYYNRQQQLILGVRYNWYEDLRRPYRKANHFPVEGRWNGMGAGQQLEQFQREITTVHRQRLDNATVANARIWKIKRNSNITPNSTIYPGKFFEVDEMDDMMGMQMGDVYSSAFTNEQQILYYHQLRSGTNELTTGQQQTGTPGTASSDLARLQEAKRRYDYTFRNSKQFVDDLIIDGVCNISQFGHRNIRYFDFVPQGELVKQFFSLPQDLIRQQIIAQIGVIGSQENRLLDRNNWTQLAQIMNQYYTAMLTLSQSLGNQELSQGISIKAMMGASEAFKQVLESFDVRNLERITLNTMLDDLFKLPSAGADPTAQGIGGQFQVPPTQIPFGSGISQGPI